MAGLEGNAMPRAFGVHPKVIDRTAEEGEQGVQISGDLLKLAGINGHGFSSRLDGIGEPPRDGGP